MFKVFMVCVAATLLMGGNGMAQGPIKKGDKAPNFELKGSDGKTYKLSDFEGKQAVIVAWFPRAFTAGCTKECKSMKEDGQQLREFDVAYFTASCDAVERNTEFAKSLELDYPILSDPDGATAKKFGIYKPESKNTARITYIIGIDGKVLDVDEAVKTETHGKDLALKLKELKVSPKKR